MAGIAGIYGNQPDIDRLKTMLDAVRHRGPDTQREFEADRIRGGVVAAELSAARGDGYAEKDGCFVLFDGEIYNDRQAGRSDADVALELYDKFGRAFAGHLQGVFACAVWDGEELVVARDSVGVRPLYFGESDGKVYFASELKALVGSVDQPRELLPGTSFSSRCGISGYLSQTPPVVMPAGEENGAKAVREVLCEAVRKRLEDGAVGACLLSGGLDSSIIAAQAYALGTELPLVTVGLEGAPDLANAELMAKHLGAKHEVFLYTQEDIISMVPKAVRTLESFDEDCVSGAISNLFASQVARKYTNCILSGEGGDELFGGYHLLKELADENERLAMMGRLVDIAYNTAVQRLDRAMLGNSINYRTPFIDSDVVALAMQLPVSWKIHPNGSGEETEKWVLREAYRDLLPDEIYRRRKLRFSAGTGTDGLMDALVSEEIVGRFEQERNTPGGYVLSSPKELRYYELFKESFPAEKFETLVGRWDPGK